MANDISIQQFTAPWALSLKIITTVSVLFLTGIPLVGTFTGPRESAVWVLLMIVMPLAILIGSLLCLIRDYHLVPGNLIIRRLLWNTQIDLSDLVSAEVDPAAMDRSMRTFGNGGLFCFAGAFRNRKLGAYRALATDPKRSVILRFAEKIVIVTPDRPDAFVPAIENDPSRDLSPR